MQQLIFKGSPHGYKFHGTSRFTDHLCTINDDGKFCSSYKYIHAQQLELKLEHKGKHAKFLDLDITIEDNVFVYKLVESFVLHVPYLSSNIPSSIFYGSIFNSRMYI